MSAILQNCPLQALTERNFSSIVVDHLERLPKQDSVAIAYIYCSYKEENQTAVNLIRSLLLQLVQRSLVISEVVALYDHHIERQTTPTLDEWSKLLQSTISRFAKAFIIVDALDECPEVNETRENFLKEIQKLQSIVNLLVTSRHDAAIEKKFERASRLEIQANHEDIRKYLEYRISELKLHVEANTTLQSEIITTIVKKAKGM